MLSEKNENRKTKSRAGCLLRLWVLFATAYFAFFSGVTIHLPHFLPIGQVKKALVLSWTMRLIIVGAGAIFILLKRRSYFEDARLFRQALFSKNPRGEEKEREWFVFGGLFLTILFGSTFLFLTIENVLISSVAIHQPFFETLGKIFSPILPILGSWVFFFLLLVGLGLFFRRLFGNPPRKAAGFLLSFWIGWAAALAGLQLWHLVLPVDWRALAFAAALSLAGHLWNAKGTRDFAGRNLPGLGVFALFFLVGSVWIANQAVFSPRMPDFGLYHIPAIRWAEAFQIIPGLGNLHGRMAFNNSSFLYAAMLEAGPFKQKAQYLTNGLLLLVLAAHLFSGASGIFSEKRARRITCLFSFLLLVPVVKWASGLFVSSPSPDVPLYALGVVMSVLLLGFLAGVEKNKKEGDFILVTIFLLACAGVTVKLSFAAFAVVTALVALGVRLVSKNGEGNRPVAKTWVFLAVVTLGITAPWVLRGLILSGYPGYPVKIGAFDVEWRVPPETLTREVSIIRGFARDGRRPPEEVLADPDWFSPWLKRTLGRTFDVLLPLALFFASLLAICLSKFFGKRTHAPPQLLGLFFLPPLASLVLWYATAPDPRFAGAAFWILAAGAVVWLTETLPHPKGTRLKIGIILFGSAFGLALFFRLYAAGGLHHGYWNIPEPDLEYKTTRSGLTLIVPDDGLCWDGPLLCTPYFDPDLRLRRPGDPGGGFLINRDGS